MGVVPATGSEVSMGKISVVLGLFANTGTVANLGLNSSLGVGRNRTTSGVASVAYLWIPCHLISYDGFSVQEQLIDGTFSESEFFS